MMKNHWTRDKDLELIRLIFEGYTQEGIQTRMELPVHSIGHRLVKLQLTMAKGREAKRNGMTPDFFLDTSPVYKPAAKIEAIYDSEGFGSLWDDAAYLLHAASNLERTAEGLRKRAEEMKAKQSVV
jgi:hypothetical protein